MNARAHAAGATQTHYTDPSGLDPATVSTAADQVQVARVALRSPVLMEIVGERAAVLPVAGVVRNYNTLLGGSTGVIGLKTGSTRAAGGCLVFAARTLVAGRQVVFIGALLGHDVGQPPLTALRSALLLVQAVLGQAQAQVVRVPVLPAGLPVASISTAWGPRTTVQVQDPPAALVLGGAQIRATARMRCPRPPVSAGTACGLVTVVVGDSFSDTSTYQVRATTSGGLSTPGWGWRLRNALGLESAGRTAVGSDRRPAGTGAATCGARPAQRPSCARVSCAIAASPVALGCTGKALTGATTGSNQRFKSWQAS